MDVAELLRLHIRRRSPGYTYADCPFCGDRRGKMCLNLMKNVWYSNCCGGHGGMLSLYAKARQISNSEAYREICEELLTGGFAPAYEVQRQETVRKEQAPQADRASAQVIHQTYSAFLSKLTLTPAHRRHLQTKRGLTDEQIKQCGFKSTPPPYLCRAITSKLIKEGCTVQGVPGFFMDDTGKWTVRYFQRTAGIIVPYVGIDGLIQGLQTRLDVPIKGKDDPPDKVGMIAGIFFGLMFGLGGIGSAFFGWLADFTSIGFIFHVSTWLPLLGIVALFLPDIRPQRPTC